MQIYKICSNLIFRECNSLFVTKLCKILSTQIGLIKLAYNTKCVTNVFEQILIKFFHPISNLVGWNECMINDHLFIDSTWARVLSIDLNESIHTLVIMQE